MADAVKFSGITKLNIPPDRVLSEAIGHLDSVVIVGFDKEGNEYFASSHADGGEVVWHLQRGIHAIMKITDQMSDDE